MYVLGVCVHVYGYELTLVCDVCECFGGDVFMYVIVDVHRPSTEVLAFDLL